MKTIKSDALIAAIKSFADSRLGEGDYDETAVEGVMCALRAHIDNFMVDDIPGLADEVVSRFGRYGNMTTMIAKLQESCIIGNVRARQELFNAIRRNLDAQIIAVEKKLDALRDEQAHANLR